jgi:hypothetical protein
MEGKEREGVEKGEGEGRFVVLLGRVGDMGIVGTGEGLGDLGEWGRRGMRGGMEGMV